MQQTYAAQVERVISITAQQLTAEGRPEAKFARAIADRIPDAQHFALPENGRLFDDELRGLDTDLRTLRLPYPTITISFANERGQRTLVVASEHERPDGAPGSIVEVVVAVDLADGEGWGFIPCAASPHAHEQDDTVVWFFSGADGRMPADDRVWGSVGQAGRSVLELVEALSCNNVASEVVERIDPAVNARRRRRGKLPLYEVRRLVVKVGDQVHAIGVPMGDRSGPREHLRRGHVRRLADGRRTWVQCCVVGARTLGVIGKSAYVVEAA